MSEPAEIVIGMSELMTGHIRDGGISHAVDLDLPGETACGERVAWPPVTRVPGPASARCG